MSTLSQAGLAPPTRLKKEQQLLATVLIVEDDPDVADLVQLNLQEMGIACQQCHRGQSGLDRALQESWDLLLLDVMLPDISGLDICQQVRREKPEQAILMVTAKNSEMDRVLGLELGADDYIGKPFSIAELQARVRSQLRKVKAIQNRLTQQQHPAERLQIGRLRIDQRQHQVQLDSQPLELTATEFELLYYLARHPNQVFSRSQLLEAVWGYHHSGYEHTVNCHINRLRNKIEQQPTQPQIVQTVWGVGYKLNTGGVV